MSGSAPQQCSAPRVSHDASHSLPASAALVSQSQSQCTKHDNVVYVGLSLCTYWLL